MVEWVLSGSSRMSLVEKEIDNMPPRLRSWQTAIIETFVRAAKLIGLPRSVGKIYGFLYSTAQP